MQVTDSQPNQYADCPPQGSILWAYDKGPFQAGDSVPVNVVHYSEDWSLGGSFTASLYLPGKPPFSFSGVSVGTTPPGECDGGDVAFIAPSDNSYRIDFGVQSGTYTAHVDGQSFTVAGPVSRQIALHAGVNVISIDTPGGASWSVSGDDMPPSLTFPSEKRTSGGVGYTDTFSVGLTESGTIKVDALRGGHLVRELVTSDTASVGAYRFTWDGTLSDGSAAPIGSYDIRVTETDWKGRTVSHDFQYGISRPTPDPAWKKAAGRIGLQLLAPPAQPTLHLNGVQVNQGKAYKGTKPTCVTAHYRSSLGATIEISEAHPDGTCGQLGEDQPFATPIVGSARAGLFTTCRRHDCAGQKPMYYMEWRHGKLDVTVFTHGLSRGDVLAFARSMRPVT